MFKDLQFYVAYVDAGVITVLAYTDLLSVFGCRMLINMKEAAEEACVNVSGSGGRGEYGHSRAAAFKMTSETEMEMRFARNAEDTQASTSSDLAGTELFRRTRTEV